jgi:hypothetical protein
MIIICRSSHLICYRKTTNSRIAVTPSVYLFGYSRYCEHLTFIYLYYISNCCCQRGKNDSVGTEHTNIYFERSNLDFTRSYYTTADGVIIGFDVCNEESFRNRETWFETINAHTTDVKKAIVGNKVSHTSLILTDLDILHRDY